MKQLQLRNRQRGARINNKLLRSIITELIENLLGLNDYQLAIHLVSAPAMAHLNEQYLDHEGPTDVITFDLREGYNLAEAKSADLAGEIYICIAEAKKQAREFRTTWQEELVRYVAHGILHLRGHDDLQPAKRKLMKREENRLVRQLKGRFTFSGLAAE